MKKYNDLNSIEDIVKDLMIDIKSLLFFLFDKKNLKIDVFITFFNIIYSAQIISIDLANLFFNHSFTKNNLCFEI